MERTGTRVAHAPRTEYIGVGAQPSEKVKVLIKKYGTNGTHLEQQKAALDKLKTTKPMAPPPMVVPRPKKAEETPAAEAAPESPESAPEAGSETSGE